MRSNLLHKSDRGAEKSIAKNGTWLICEPAIVAENDDPEKQHRIKVILPKIDENLIFDEWIRPSAFCLGDGFGSVFIPPIGTEVLVTGTLGQKFNLSYISTFNEENFIPSELNKDVAGIKAPKDLQFIAVQVIKLLAAEIHIIAEGLAELKGDNVTVEAENLMQVKGSQVNVDAENQMTIHGATVTINSDGSINITGQNISISSSGSLTLENRLVRKILLPI